MKINEVVRQMHPPRYTITQAAQLVGRNVDTLRRWRKDGVYRESDSKRFGTLDVALYTDADIAALRLIAKTRRPGRKRKETTQQ